MTGQISSVGPIRGSRCPAGCRFAAEARDHHDRLLDIDREVERLLDLLELALTWDELDYTEYGVIQPEQWDDFLAVHRWRDPARAARAFSLAQDLVMRRRRLLASTEPAPDGSVFSALTGQQARLVLVPDARG